MPLGVFAEVAQKVVDVPDIDQVTEAPKVQTVDEIGEVPVVIGGAPDPEGAKTAGRKLFREQPPERLLAGPR